MRESQSVFIEYIDEIAKELVAAHAEAQLQQDIKSYIGNMDQLTRFTQQLPSKIKLNQTINLLRINNELYMDLIQPALVKRLGNVFQASSQ